MVIAGWIIIGFAILALLVMAKGRVDDRHSVEVDDRRE